MARTLSAVLSNEITIGSRSTEETQLHEIEPLKCRFLTWPGEPHQLSFYSYVAKPVSTLVVYVRNMFV